MEVVAKCPYCGEPIDLWVDESGGSAQTYVEDCSVCCQPIDIRASLGPDRVDVWVKRQDGENE